MTRAGFEDEEAGISALSCEAPARWIKGVGGSDGIATEANSVGLAGCVPDA